VFLGLNGVVVKSHGGTDALGFATAIDVAIEMVRNNLVEKIRTDMVDLGEIAAEAMPKELVDNSG
jgi:glycerol-3-phosphate acyltransferase PlsX